jgi:fibronectin-binding autotransporter adhesin
VLGVDMSAGDRTFANSISGTIGLAVTGANRLVLSSSNTLGAITVTNATLTVSNTSGLLGSGAITVDGGTVEWDPVAAANYSFNGRAIAVTGSGGTFRSIGSGQVSFGSLSGTGAVIFASGSGTLVIGSNTYSGGTTIKPGAFVAYTADGGFGTGPLTIEGGSLRSTTSANRTVANDTTLAGDVNFINFSTGNDRDLVFTGPMTIAGATRTVTVNTSPIASSTGIFFNGPIGDGGNALGLVKTGTSMLILGGANTYSGTTTLSAGTLRLDNADALGGGGDLSFTGGTLQYTASNTADYGGRIRSSAAGISVDTNGQTVTWNGAVDSSNVGGLAKSGSGTLVLGGNNTYAGTTTVSGGTLQIGAGGTSGSIAGDVALSNTTALVFNRSDDLAYAGAISGTGSFTKLGAGTLTLSGSASTRSGPIAILGGTLMTTNGASLTAGSQAFAFTIDGGTLMSAPGAPANGFSSRFTSLAIGSGGATIRSDQRTDNSSVISGTSPTASLTYGTSSGTVSGVLMIVSGNNTYAGGTRIESGIAMVVDNNAAFGTGTLELAGAIIRSRDGPARSLANAVTISANTQFNATAAQPNLTFTGPVTLSGGSRTLQVDNVHTSGTSAGQPGVIFTNTIGDGGNGYGLTKTGTGTLLLAGNNTYGGATTVSAGTLIVNGNQSAATGAVSVAAIAALMGSGTIGGNTTIAGLHSPGNSPGIQTFTSDVTYSGGSSTVLWELAANTVSNSPLAYDQIVVGGNLDFAGLTTLSLSFNDTGSTVNWADSFWGEERVWTLYSVTGETTNFGNLAIIQASWLDSQSQTLESVRAGSTFSIRQDGDDVSIVYAVVPEPAGIVGAGIGLAMAGLTLLRRRHAAAIKRRSS